MTERGTREGIDTTDWLCCPFCGGRPTLICYKDESLRSHDQVDWFEVLCDDCDLRTPNQCEGFDEVEKHWNTRKHNVECERV
jgi:hypothetical protein